MKSLAYVLLILGSLATDLVSDLFLRSAHIAGTNPHSYDVTCSLLIGGAVAGLIMEQRNANK